MLKNVTGGQTNANEKFRNLFSKLPVNFDSDFAKLQHKLSGIQTVTVLILNEALLSRTSKDLETPQ